MPRVTPTGSHLCSARARERSEDVPASLSFRRDAALPIPRELLERAARFRLAYPGSVFLPSVDAAAG